jgi:hypothetical protein
MRRNGSSSIFQRSISIEHLSYVRSFEFCGEEIDLPHGASDPIDYSRVTLAKSAIETENSTGCLITRGVFKCKIDGKTLSTQVGK